MSVSHPAIVLCYGHRDDAREYWFGLYKLTATPDGTTVWYDGNPSTFRDWTNKEPDEDTVCIRYKTDGFRDGDCSSQSYYICKKAAGNFCAVIIITDLHFSLCLGCSLPTCTHERIVSFSGMGC